MKSNNLYSKLFALLAVMVLLLCSCGTKECKECNGEGYTMKECEDCNGNGYFVVTCRECDGDGWNYCSSCDGTGRDECTWCWGKMRWQWQSKSGLFRV